MKKVLIVCKENSKEDENRQREYQTCRSDNGRRRIE